RALKRLPIGSPALPELPYLLGEVPEPGVMRLLGQFLAHKDPDAVAAAIEVLAEIGDPQAVKLLEPLVEDTRVVELADDGGDDTSEASIGELAGEAIELLQSFGDPLSAPEAAMFEDSVVPRYLSFFGGLVADMLIPSPSAQIAHIACRTGYPDPIVAEKLPRSVLVGVDG